MGKNFCGQLGISTTGDDYRKPTKIKFPLDIPIRYISARDSPAAAIDFNYNVYIWGSNNYGQLGLGDNVNKNSPTIVEQLTDKKLEKIYCVNDYTFALTQNGQVYFWGYNHIGMLGIGKYRIANTPIKIKFPDSTLIKKLYVGKHHVFAIEATSKIYSWGINTYYQLCKGNNKKQYAPYLVSMLGDFNIDKIICLSNYTIILANNELYSIGFGRYGELGLGIGYTKEITLIAEG